MSGVIDATGEKLSEGQHYVALEGTLVLSGNRIGVQVGAHEVLYLDALLRGLVGKEIELRVVEKVK